MWEALALSLACSPHATDTQHPDAVTHHTAPTHRDTGLTASYSFEPLTNLVYTRDQQITTGRGVVMARLRSAQRQKEAALMAYCWQKLGECLWRGLACELLRRGQPASALHTTPSHKRCVCIAAAAAAPTQASRLLARSRPLASWREATSSPSPAVTSASSALDCAQTTRPAGAPAVCCGCCGCCGCRCLLLARNGLCAPAALVLALTLS